MSFDVVISAEPPEPEHPQRVLTVDLGQILLYRYEHAQPPLGPDDNFHLFAGREAPLTDVGNDILGRLHGQVNGVVRTEIWCTAHTFWFVLEPQANPIALIKHLLVIIGHTYATRQYSLGQQLPPKPSYGCALGGEAPVPLSLGDPIILGRLRRLGAPQEVSERFIQDALNRLGF